MLNMVNLASSGQALSLLGQWRNLLEKIQLSVSSKPSQLKPGKYPRTEDIVQKFHNLVSCRVIFIPHRQQKATPADYGLPFEEVKFYSLDGLQLVGWHIQAENSRATVIVAHGYRQNKADYLAHAGWLYRAGYSVLLFDFRAHGLSEGPLGTSIGYMERLDIQGAVAFLQAKGSNNIALLGFSMGAAASIIAAAENPAIQAVIADCRIR